MTESSPDWERITELLAEAVEQPPARRRAWLYDTGEPVSRIAQLEKLLAAYEADPNYLEPEFPIPAKLGPWIVRRELGQGGMGRVFEAMHEDPALARRVALKVVGASRAVPGLREAFLQERAILARLEHPAIARLYDTGSTAEGLPYFAMEFVSGIPYDCWLRERDPSLRERIRLLAAIAEAVAYAHRRFVAHGDLKPSNILITETGEPRLLDFGIARAWNVAEPGALPMLTPAHASPEQLQGKPITAASDVYQMGLLLKAALSGTDRELDAIAACCLQENPERRYPSAEAMRADLLAWLEHRPVSVMGRHPAYLLKKRVRRHPMTAALVLALLLGVVAVVWQAQRAEAHRAEAERQSLQTRRFARSLLAIIPSLPASEQRSIVESTVKLLEQMAANPENDPVLQLEIAHAWMSLGHVQGLPTARNLGDPESAARSYAQAIALAERAKARNRSEAVWLLAPLYASAARVEQSLQRPARVRVFEQKLSELIPALESLGASNELGYAYAELAYLRTSTDRATAMSLYDQAVDTYNRTASPDLPQKAYALKRWGALLLASQNLEAGIRRYEEALAIERATNVPPFELSFTLSDLGLACRRQKRFGDAERYYREALEIRKRAAAEDPKDVRAAAALATVHWRLGWVYADAGRPEAAIPWGRRAVEMSEALARSSPALARHRRDLAYAQVYLAEFLVLAEAKAKGRGRPLPAIAEQMPEVQQLLLAASAANRQDPDPNLTAELAALGAPSSRMSSVASISPAAPAR